METYDFICTFCEKCLVKEDEIKLHIFNIHLEDTSSMYKKIRYVPNIEIEDIIEELETSNENHGNSAALMPKKELETSSENQLNDDQVIEELENSGENQPEDDQEMAKIIQELEGSSENQLNDYQVIEELEINAESQPEDDQEMAEIIEELETSSQNSLIDDQVIKELEISAENQPKDDQEMAEIIEELETSTENQLNKDQMMEEMIEELEFSGENQPNENSKNSDPFILHPPKKAIVVYENEVNSYQEKKNPFHCNLCSLTFSSQSDLEHHDLIKHNVFDNEDEFDETDQGPSKRLKKEHPCKHCFSMFITKERAHRHGVFVCINNPKALKNRKIVVENGKYFCPECPKKFDNWFNFHRHFDRRHIDEPQKCPKCSYLCKNSECLYKHLRMGNCIKMVESCKHCDAKFKSELRAHLHQLYYCENNPKALKKRVIIENGKHVCPECFKDYDSWILLTRHFDRCHCINPKKCPKCGLKFKNAEYLSKHLNVGRCKNVIKKENLNKEKNATSKEHESNIELKRNVPENMLEENDPKIDSTENMLHSCSHCVRNFNNEDKVRVHQSYYCDNNPKALKNQDIFENGKFVCPECQKEYDSWILLMRHFDRCHWINLKECPKCGLILKNVEYFNNHLRLCKDIKKKVDLNKENIKDVSENHQSRKRLHSCSHCYTNFKNEERVRLHQVYDCASNPEALKKRVIIENGSYKCWDCLKGFKDWVLLVRHYDRIHSNNPVQCPKCGIFYSSSENLRNHLRIGKCRNLVKDKPKEDCLKEDDITILDHNKSKDFYPCRFCSKNYKKEEKVRLHEIYFCDANPEALKKRVKVNDGKFKCWECPKDFDTLEILVRHFERAHYQKQIDGPKSGTFYMNMTNEEAESNKALKENVLEENLLENVSENVTEYMLEENVTIEELENVSENDIIYIEDDDLDEKVSRNLQSSRNDSPRALEKITTSKAKASQESSFGNLYDCSHCYRNFISETKAYQHQIFLCENNPDALKKRAIIEDGAHKCWECFRNFAYWDLLKLHFENMHMGKPTNCLKCDLSFKNEEYMQIHLRNCGLRI